MIYGTKAQASQYDGDCIIQIENIIYIGKLKPGYPRTANDAPVEQQPVWQIERVEMTTEKIQVYNPETEEDENVDKDIITRMYPNGNEDYRFAISDYLTYNYEYRH